ncbi:MAG: protease inhibitor I42 family protein [Dehalococcoidales bacterium]
MKKLVILGLVSMLLLPLLTLGCSEKAATETTSSPKDQTVAITLDEFAQQKSMLKYVEMVKSGTLTVRLGSNPSTGYSWGDAQITHPDVIKQISRNYEKPTATGLMGAPGTEVWVFETTDTGLAMIKMSYSRPWETGANATFDITVNINVR